MVQVSERLKLWRVRVTKIILYVIHSFLVCEDPIGIERGLFTITATSYRGTGYEPWRGRLNSAGIWRANSNSQFEFLQVRFDHVMDVTGIATQGDTVNCGRVQRFYLYYSLEGLRFDQYIDPFIGEVSS